MSAIITITFNPCIDVHVSVAALIPELKLRCGAPLLQPGGGGINVARAIKQLGGDATAIYLAAGNNGKELTRMLEEEGIRSVVLSTDGNTRENLMVVDRSTGSQYRFILPGPAVANSALKNLAEIIDQENPGFMVVSGSLPPGLDTSIFSELAAIAAKKGIRLVVDTSEEALKKAVESGVYMIKPSIRELISLARMEGNERNIDIKNINIEALAKKLIVNGNCRVVVVSLGADGALLVTNDHVCKILPPSVKAISTVGAGDSMVAGIVWKLSLGKEVEEAVEYGCACGSAAIMNPGTSLCHLQDVEKIYAQMHQEHYISCDQNYTLL